MLENQLFWCAIEFSIVDNMNSTPKNTYLHQISSWFTQWVQSYGARMGSGGPQMRLEEPDLHTKVLLAGVEPGVDSTVLGIAMVLVDHTWFFLDVYGRIGCRIYISKKKLILNSPRSIFITFSFLDDMPRPGLRGRRLASPGPPATNFRLWPPCNYSQTWVEMLIFFEHRLKIM